jgi:hypothetical protein
MERDRPDRTITLRPRKRRKTIQHTRTPCSIYVTSCDELVYITAERGHWGTMLSELDELGRMICRRCVETKRLVEFRGVVYMPPTIKACEDEALKKLWIQSAAQ